LGWCIIALLLVAGEIQFWFAVIGALGLVIAANLIASGAGIVAAVIASALTIIGAALMAFLFWTTNAG
jgi:hypothetical protein